MSPKNPTSLGNSWIALRCTTMFKRAHPSGGACHRIKASFNWVLGVIANGLGDPRAWRMSLNWPNKNLPFYSKNSSILLKQDALCHFQRYQTVVRNVVAQFRSLCLPFALASTQVLQYASSASCFTLHPLSSCHTDQARGHSPMTCSTNSRAAPHVPHLGSCVSPHSARFSFVNILSWSTNQVKTGILWGAFVF